MKIISAACVLGLVSVSYWYGSTRLDNVIGVPLQGAVPSQTKLSSTPRSQFTPTTRKGYYNLDIVGDFTLPATKTITFSGAGRNLHTQQDPTKIFRRGFSAVDQSRMIEGLETWKNGFPAKTWKSNLAINQRAWIVYQNYFRDSFGLTWAQSNDKASETLYRVPGQDPNKPTTTNRNSIYQASMELRGSCLSFGDCPADWRSTYGYIFLDIENNYGIKDIQEQANLYVYMMKTIKENSSPQTLIGSIDPVGHNSFGYSRTEDYRAGADELLTLPVRHTATSRRRGMPDDIVGKSFSDYADFVMPGTYYLYPEFDYSSRHNGDGDRHWLGALLGEQEVNMKLSPKKRIAWHWVFNTQSGDLPNSAKSEHPAPPAIAEGTAIFYWFTGAYGVLFWDDQINLNPDQPSPADPNLRGIGNDRNYACYEHYVHGLWRLFKHHGDLFNGRETYLNEATECSYDGGKTWYKYNANQLKTRDLPFVRAIVNGDQILVAATKPYAQPGQVNQVMVRYVQDGYSFYSTISLKGDEIYLGRATMAGPR